MDNSWVITNKKKKKKVALRYSLTFTGKAKESHYNPRTARAVLGLLHIHTSFKHGARNSLLHQIMRRGSCQISPSRSDSGLITNLEDVIMRVKQTTSSGCAECIWETGRAIGNPFRCELVVRSPSVCFWAKIGWFKGRTVARTEVHK